MMMALEMAENLACPCCGGSATREIYALDAIPVQSCILLDTAEEARDFPRHPLKLRFCDDCGFIYNSVFDEKLVDYASTTEESQHFSGTFNKFAKELVDEIAETYPLQGKQILEIGCGKGDFLRELCEHTGGIGLGVDPGFIPDRLPLTNGGEVAFQREYFDPATIKVQPDHVSCRHTLEHIGPVQQFIRDIRTAIGERRGPDGLLGVFFETPGMTRILEEGAFWDIYFEHCSYFTEGAHARLFRREGFDVTRLYMAYDNQYIIQYADPVDGPTEPRFDIERDLDRVRELAAAFPETIERARQYWKNFVESRANAGKRVAIWGGGSKGVSFVTSVDLGHAVHTVVDINPHKQGKFLPGTGHRVSAPVELKETPPDTVIVMNPIYLTEIGRDLENMGLSPELVAV
ncbi:MAG: class I SAM-dependent methyltransferase [Pseudomonadota bacterium]